jgi:hypothetical protein
VKHRYILWRPVRGPGSREAASIEAACYLDVSPADLHDAVKHKCSITPFQICFPNGTFHRVRKALREDIHPQIWNFLKLRQNGILTEVPCPEKASHCHILLIQQEE